MHPVLRRVVGLDRQERAGADMQRHLVDGDAAAARAVSASVGREMQSRGRRRDRAFVEREHGLVVGVVARVGRTPRGDVRRQRHVAPLLDRLVEHRPVERERQRHLAALALALRPWRRAGRGSTPCPPRRTARCRRARAASPAARRRASATPSRRRCKRRLDGGLASPRPMRRPFSRAGITLVSLTTSASPARSRSGRSRTQRSSSSGSAPGRTTSRRAASRGAIGRNAIRSGGRSKSNRSVRINTRHRPQPWAMTSLAELGCQRPDERQSLGGYGSCP